MNLKMLSLSLITAISLFLSAFTDQSKENEKTNDDEHAEHSASNDIREETTGVESLPSFLTDKPEDMQAIYSAAAKIESS